MIDVIQQIQATQREVGSGRLAGDEAHTVRLQRTFRAPVEDVWDALTNPDRIGRWFLPISGDYRIGGHYQFEGNAGGEILACERPNRLLVSWIYGGPEAPGSEVESRLAAAADDSTVLDFLHTAVVPDEMWGEYGPGAVGVGWEMGLLGLELHLIGGSVGDPIAWQVSDEGREFATRSSAGWGEASRAAGVDDATVARNVASTSSFYAPPAEG